jgi:hypothetical protein
MAQPQVRFRTREVRVNRMIEDDIQPKPLLIPRPESTSSYRKKTTAQAVTINKQTTVPAVQTPSVHKLTTIPKKVTWISTPLTTKHETNIFLEFMFARAPMIDEKGAYQCLLWVSIALTATAGYVLPYFLWGR